MLSLPHCLFEDMERFNSISDAHAASWDDGRPSSSSCPPKTALTQQRGKRAKPVHSLTSLVLLAIGLLSSSILVNAISDPGPPALAHAAAPATAHKDDKKSLSSPQLLRSLTASIHSPPPLQDHSLMPLLWQHQPVSIPKGCHRTSQLISQSSINPWAAASQFLLTSPHAADLSGIQSDLILCPVGKDETQSYRLLSVSGLIAIPIPEKHPQQKSTTATWPQVGQETEGFWRQRNGQLQWEPQYTDPVPLLSPDNDNTQQQPSPSADPRPDTEAYHKWSESIGGENAQDWLSFNEWKQKHFAQNSQKERRPEKKKHKHSNNNVTSNGNSSHHSSGGTHSQSSHNTSGSHDNGGGGHHDSANRSQPTKVTEKQIPKAEQNDSSPGASLPSQAAVVVNNNTGKDHHSTKEASQSEDREGSSQSQPQSYSQVNKDASGSEPQSQDSSQNDTYNRSQEEQPLPARLEELANEQDNDLSPVIAEDLPLEKDSEAPSTGPEISSDSPMAQSAIPAVRDPASMLKTLRHRWNFASMDCAAVVHRTNPSAKFASSILSEKKDRYLLSPCPDVSGGDSKGNYVIVELCDEINIDTIVLANYEFFSRMFKRFKISVAQSLSSSKESEGWHELGIFRARNLRGVQVFQAVKNKTPSSRFFRYVRIDFLEYYGNEFYCPLSLLRVYGLTQMDDYRREEEEERKAAQAAAEAAAEAEKRSQYLAIGDGEYYDEEEEDDDLEVEEDYDEHEMENLRRKAANTSQLEDTWDAIWNGNPIARPLQTQPQPSAPEEHWIDYSAGHASSPSSSSGPPGVAEASTAQQQQQQQPLQSASVSAPASSPPSPPPSPSKGASPSPVCVPSEGPRPRDDLLSKVKQDETCSSSLSRSTSPSQTMKASSNGRATPSAHHAHTSSSAHYSPPPVNNGNGHGSASSSSSGSESIYRTITKRLNALEANATLSLQYIEHSGQALREVFRAMEKRQETRLIEMLRLLNSSNWKQIETLKRKQSVDLQKAIFEFDLHRREIDLEKNHLSNQISLLTNEVYFERRLGIVQLILLLGLFSFMLLTRGPTSHPPGNGTGSLLQAGIARLSLNSKRGHTSADDVETTTDEEYLQSTETDGGASSAVSVSAAKPTSTLVNRTGRPVRLPLLRTRSSFRRNTEAGTGYRSTRSSPHLLNVPLPSTSPTSTTPVADQERSPPVEDPSDVMETTTSSTGRVPVYDIAEMSESELREYLGFESPFDDHRSRSPEYTTAIRDDTETGDEDAETAMEGSTDTEEEEDDEEGFMPRSNTLVIPQHLTPRRAASAEPSFSSFSHVFADDDDSQADAQAYDSNLERNQADEQAYEDEESIDTRGGTLAGLTAAHSLLTSTPARRRSRGKTPPATTTLHSPSPLRSRMHLPHDSDDDDGNARDEGEREEDHDDENGTNPWQQVLSRRRTSSIRDVSSPRQQHHHYYHDGQSATPLSPSPSRNGASSPLALNGSAKKPFQRGHHSSDSSRWTPSKFESPFLMQRSSSSSSSSSSRGNGSPMKVKR
ncbi:unnamed protein product [Sympodiomycopsis kandeliae]